jgi:hypothetical protein
MSKEAVRDPLPRTVSSRESCSDQEKGDRWSTCFGKQLGVDMRERSGRLFASIINAGTVRRQGADLTGQMLDLILAALERSSNKGAPAFKPVTKGRLVGEVGIFFFF